MLPQPQSNRETHVNIEHPYLLLFFGIPLMNERLYALLLAIIWSLQELYALF